MYDGVGAFLSRDYGWNPESGEARWRGRRFTKQGSGATEWWVLILLYVGIGAACGGLCRYGIGGACARLLPGAFPFATLAANLLGAFLIGCLMGCGGGSAEGFALAGAGFCGGLTTFSSFSLENLALLSSRRWWLLVTNCLGSLALSLLCLAAGVQVGEGLAQ